MRIDRVETLRADAAWRSFSFLKVTTACGITRWSEYNKDSGSRGLSPVIEAPAQLTTGADPDAPEAMLARVHVATRQARGGINQQAIAAIENALRDIRAKQAGKPVHALFGGPIRERIPVYRSHFGTHRAAQRGKGFLPDLRTHDDLSVHAAEVKAHGFRCLKTSLFRHRDGALQYLNEGFDRTPGWPELNWDEALLADLRCQLSAIRDPVGRQFGVTLDVNPHFKTEGFLCIAETVAEFGLRWLEIDTRHPATLALIRGRAVPDRELRDPARPAPFPSVSRNLRHGRRDHRRAAERACREPEDRRAGRHQRGELRAAELLRPSLLVPLRPLLGRGAELPHHGDRSRLLPLARRVRHRHPRDRERRARAADCARLGGRHQRVAVRARPRKT